MNVSDISLGLGLGLGLGFRSRLGWVMVGWAGRWVGRPVGQVR